MDDAANLPSGCRARPARGRSDRPDARARGDEIPLLRGAAPARERRPGKAVIPVRVCRTGSNRATCSRPPLPRGRVADPQPVRGDSEITRDERRAERCRRAIVGGVNLGDRAVSGVQRPPDCVRLRRAATDDCRLRSVRRPRSNGRRSQPLIPARPCAGVRRRGCRGQSQRRSRLRPGACRRRRRATAAGAPQPRRQVRGAGVPSSGSWFRMARSSRCSSGPGSTPSSSASSSRVAR